MKDYKESAAFIKECLDRDDWHYQMDDTGDFVVFKGGIGGFEGLYDSFRFTLFVRANEAQTFALFPLSAKNKLPEMAEFLTRANYGLTYGAFEMDWNDGEIRFHLTFPVAAIKADGKLVNILLGLPAQTLDKYAKGITEVLMGAKSAEEAIKDCEG